MSKVAIGLYRHYKNIDCEVIGTGKHTETEEELVFYRKIGETFIWARPLSMFCENVIIDGEEIPRFTQIVR